MTKRKVTPVNCICVTMQIWQINHKKKKEIWKNHKLFSPTDTLTKLGKKSLLLPSRKIRVHTCIFSFLFFFLETKSLKMSISFLHFSLFFLRDQVPKNVLFPFLLIKSQSLYFFLLRDNVSSNIIYVFVFLFLCRSSSLSIEQVITSETCVGVGVVWSC